MQALAKMLIRRSIGVINLVTDFSNAYKVVVINEAELLAFIYVLIQTDISFCNRRLSARVQKHTVNANKKKFD